MVEPSLLCPAQSSCLNRLQFGLGPLVAQKLHIKPILVWDKRRWLDFRETKKIEISRLWSQDRVNERINLLKNQLCYIVDWIPPAQFIHQQTTESLVMSKRNRGASLRTGAGLLMNLSLSSDDLESQWLAPLMKMFGLQLWGGKRNPSLKAYKHWPCPDFLYLARGQSSDIWVNNSYCVSVSKLDTTALRSGSSWREPECL